MPIGMCSGVIDKGPEISKSSTDLDRVKLCGGIGIGCRGVVCDCMCVSLVWFVSFGVVLDFLPKDLKCDSMFLKKGECPFKQGKLG